MRLTIGQTLAIAHISYHSLAKPRDKCRRCKRLRKRLTKKEQT